MSKWTQFHDMHSGGGLKEKPYGYIYIEAPKEEAKVIFYNRFGHNPSRVSCTCCGDDYSITESDSLAEASGFERGCAYVYRNKKGEIVPENLAWKSGVGLLKGCTGGYEDIPNTKYKFRDYEPLEKYLKREDVLVIYSKDIKKSERIGDVPQQGYVWQD